MPAINAFIHTSFLPSGSVRPSDLTQSNVHVSSRDSQTQTEDDSSVSNVLMLSPPSDMEKSAYDVASMTYENGLFDPAGLQKHRFNQHAISKALSPWLDSGLHRDSCALAQVVRDVVTHLAQTGQLHLDCYREREAGVHGYGKFLLYSHGDETFPFCLQLFAFKPGQRTPLHDHPCECMSVVVRGSVIEELYESSEGALGKLTSRSERLPDSSASISLDELSVVHRLINDRHVELGLSARRGSAHGQQGGLKVDLKPAPVALTVHLYQGMDGALHETQAVSQQRFELPQQRRAIAAVSRIYA